MDLDIRQHSENGHVFILHGLAVVEADIFNNTFLHRLQILLSLPEIILPPVNLRIIVKAANPSGTYNYSPTPC